ncbi:DUF4837 family protein [Flavobacterium sp. SUN052]|uniref:DUF4837 family protein n=1 Tax=Flavobacterium sp. SUN052 TaxID=3002441 RepID=UPI00237E9E8F|nr:DUF4837 family protein [Flavobacterium sp. SUN052]MEC4003565.1 DUF4837 family protein [Flavobacterium sp. SUN052]
MNKAHFLILLLATLVLSCNSKEEKSTLETSGKINEVAVIIDDQLWNGEIGDSMRNKFAAPVLGLPQEEPVFTLNQYPVKLLEGFMSNSRNIIVIKKEAKSQLRIEKNEFANPQVVVHISGETVQEILDSIQNNDSLIINKIKESEIKILQQKIKGDSLLDVKKIIEKFNVKLTIPVKYKMVLNGKKFLWFKKEITSGNLSLIFYQIPLSSIKDNNKTINRITNIRDSIGRIYIHGAVPHTRMITEPAFSPYLSKTKIYNKETFETKGNWELLHDFMNGPFINYAIVDKPNNRILVIEGFCYAPSKQKRDLMFELEAIIKSVQFLKKK